MSKKYVHSGISTLSVQLPNLEIKFPLKYIYVSLFTRNHLLLEKILAKVWAKEVRLKVNKSRKHFFLKLYCLQNERNIWQNVSCSDLFLGNGFSKKKNFWDLLTFTLKFWVYVHGIKPILGQVQVRQLLYNAYVLKPVRDTAGLKFHFSFFVVSQWKPRYPLLIMLRRLSMPAADQERLDYYYSQVQC